MKGKDIIIEEMEAFLIGNGFKEEIRTILKKSFELRKKNAIFILKETLELEKRLNNDQKTAILGLFYKLESLKETGLFNNYDVHRILTGFFIGEKGKIEAFTNANIKKLYRLMMMDFPEKLANLIIEKEIANFDLDLNELAEKIAKMLAFVRIIEEIQRISGFLEDFDQKITFQEIISEIVNSDEICYNILKKSLNWKDFFSENSGFLAINIDNKEKLILLISDYFFSLKS